MALFTKEYIGLQTDFEDILDASLAWGSGLEDVGINTLKPVVSTAQSTITTFAPITSFDLGSLGNDNGVSITGIGAFDFSGSAVSNAGDINGDGIDDFIIGAQGADTNGNLGSGQAYIIFGSDTGLGTNINLGDLDGTNGFAVNGLAAGDRLGASVSGIG
ncbi:MAG: integrin alpha, partial [Planctomycetes bacterium]|nr:integrin alpha [Planctomycetota bacterium]